MLGQDTGGNTPNEVVTVTASRCPYMPYNLEPLTLLQNAECKLWEMEQWAASGLVTIEQDARDALDWLWARLKSLWDFGPGALVSAVQQGAQSLWNDVTALWHRFRAAASGIGSSLTNGLLIAGGIALLLFFSPEIVKSVKEASS